MYNENPSVFAALRGIFTLWAQELHAEGRCLRRNAGGLEIGVCNLVQLSGAECIKPDRTPKTVGDGGRIRDDKPCLRVYIIRVSRVEKTVGCVDRCDSVCRDGRRGLRSALYDNDERIRLRRQASCHACRKNGVYPHPLLYAAGAYPLPEGIESDGILIQVEP